MRPLDVHLGPGAHVQIRTLIGAHRGYSPAPFVLNHAAALRLAGAAMHEARPILVDLCRYVPNPGDFNHAVALARALFTANWTYLSVRACVTAFRTAGSNPNGLTGAQWGLIGGELPADEPVSTAAFARTRGQGNGAWNHGSTRLLARAFAASNPNGFSAAQWLQVAAVLPANEHANTAAFARFRGQGNTAWNLASILLLKAAFAGSNPNGLTSAQWGQIAAALPANQHANTATFARVQAQANANWNAASAVLLAGAFRGSNPNGLTAAQWVLVANELPANDHLSTTAIARVQAHANANWNAASVVLLARAFAGSNPNGLTAAQWVLIANQLPANDHLSTTAFTRVRGRANSAWNAVGCRTLANAFRSSNPNALTAAQWCLIANELNANQHATTAVFSRVRGRTNTAWNTDSATRLARAFRASNPNGFSASRWAAIAAVLVANQHGNTTTFARAAQWAHGDVIALATRFGNDARGQGAADWITMANRIFPRNGWAAYAERAMNYRRLGWADTVAIRTVALQPTVAWHLEASNDGVIYRRTGVGNPHLTLHQVNTGPNQWTQGGSEFHVVTGGLNSPWDFDGRNYNPFLQQGQNQPVVIPLVAAVAGSFCDAMNI